MDNVMKISILEIEYNNLQPLYTILCNDGRVLEDVSKYDIVNKMKLGKIELVQPVELVTEKIQEYSKKLSGQGNVVDATIKWYDKQDSTFVVDKRFDIITQGRYNVRKTETVDAADLLYTCLTKSRRYNITDNSLSLLREGIDDIFGKYHRQAIIEIGPIEIESPTARVNINKDATSSPTAKESNNNTSDASMTEDKYKERLQEIDYINKSTDLNNFRNLSIKIVANNIHIKESTPGMLLRLKAVTVLGYKVEDLDVYVYVQRPFHKGIYRKTYEELFDSIENGKTYVKNMETMEQITSTFVALLERPKDFMLNDEKPIYNEYYKSEQG